jgi:phosphoenolpyruvate-protein phosphotransferase (PTS system enzyme I)
VAAAKAAGKGVSMCGEMAGDPRFTETLLSFGLERLSMDSSSIPEVKRAVAGIGGKR